MNVLNLDHNQETPEFVFHYDIKKWLDDPGESALERFKSPIPIRIIFNLTKEQYKLVSDQLSIHGNTQSGRTQVLKHIPVDMLWRQPIILN